MPDALFERISSLSNVLLAARVAARGKRFRRSAAGFLLRLEQFCLRLSDALADGSWRPSPYRVFAITDPKPRTICAAPFADRVVHQALVQVVEPFFERGFVHDSYSCRVGKGTHAALLRGHPGRPGGFGGRSILVASLLGFRSPRTQRPLVHGASGEEWTVTDVPGQKCHPCSRSHAATHACW